jgi:hypothetical protein
LDPVTVLLRVVLVPFSVALLCVLAFRARRAKGAAVSDTRGRALAAAAGIAGLAGVIAVPLDVVLIPKASVDWVPHVLLAALLAGTPGRDDAGRGGSAAATAVRWVLRGAVAALVGWIAAPRRDPLLPLLVIAGLVLALTVVYDRLAVAGGPGRAAGGEPATGDGATSGVPAPLAVAGLAAGISAAAVIHGGLAIIGQMCGALAVAFGATVVVARALRGPASAAIPLAAAAPVFFAALGHTRGELPATAALVLALAPAGALVPGGLVRRAATVGAVAVTGVVLAVVLA